ncbi:hypothetical protein J2D73_10735 [Acetobacter sacchari]|uniref:Uncharacterized protein n=1 Tax=Acetobacter sacchari TaxID=2661687 RepID=A0ABS3LWH8_9PROT|nr:hypothetical protein [Acetobacter sacchari]MBO1360262.1 hypothetical protein [Acetobacter sacchari]
MEHAPSANFVYDTARDGTLHEAVDRGIPYRASMDNLHLVGAVLQKRWDRPIIERRWKLLAGAYGEQSGPT